MTRAKRAESEKTKPVRVGDLDLMSRLVKSMRLPVCGEISAGVGADRPCTRASGHDESTQKHPGTDHVHAASGYLVVAVWSA